MKKENSLVEFKSGPAYYHDEVAGNKNNTVRRIDWEDERFSLLNLMRNRNDYGYIKIKYTEECQGHKISFKRAITNVAIWNDLMIISWQHSE